MHETETFLELNRRLEKDEVPALESVLFHRLQSPAGAAHFVGA